MFGFYHRAVAAYILQENCIRVYKLIKQKGKVVLTETLQFSLVSIISAVLTTILVLYLGNHITNYCSGHSRYWEIYFDSY